MSDKMGIKQAPIRFNETQALLKKLQEKLAMPVIVYWTSYNGGICQNDVNAFYNLFKKVGRQEKIALFIRSMGGDTLAALRIVNVIRQYASYVTALVPLDAASAATLVTLGADEVQMGPLSYLTPIDSSNLHQLSPTDPVTNAHVAISQNEIQRLEKLWRENAPENSTLHPYQELYKYIHPVVLGALDRSRSLSIRVGKTILATHNPDLAECERISEKLNSDYPSHSYPIVLQEARELGLNAQEMDAATHDLLLELNGLYAEMGNKTHSDFDEFNFHDNQILNILETSDSQLYYQNDKDWSYIKEERRWQVLNDNSYWYKLFLNESSQLQKQILYIS